MVDICGDVVTRKMLNELFSFFKMFTNCGGVEVISTSFGVVGISVFRIWNEFAVCEITL